MNITVKYIPKKNCVFVKPIAVITNENIKIALEKGYKVAKEHNCNYLLFNITECPIGQSIIEGMAFMQNIGKNAGIPNTIFFAVVIDPSKYPTDRASMVENIVMNRPNPRMGTFTDAKKAEKWLVENQT